MGLAWAGYCEYAVVMGGWGLGAGRMEGLDIVGADG